MKKSQFVFLFIFSLFYINNFAADIKPAVQASPASRTYTVTEMVKISTVESGLTIYGLTFAKNSSEIPAEADARLDEIVKTIGEFLGKNENPVIQIDGYTDSTGSEGHNIILSGARANSVMVYIFDKCKDKGLVEKDFVIRGLGPTNFIADNATEDGRSKNRRIEMKITGKTMEKKIIIGETENKEAPPAVKVEVKKAEALKEHGICWGCIGLDALDLVLAGYTVYAVNQQWTAADNYNKNQHASLDNPMGTNYDELVSMKQTAEDKNTPVVVGACLAGAAIVYTVCDIFWLHWVYQVDVKPVISTANNSVNGVMVSVKEAF